MHVETPRLDRIFRIYSLLLGTGGAILLLRTPVTSFVDNAKYAGVTILHLIGALLVVSATFAAALARIDDPVSRQRASAYFLLGQWVSALLIIAKYQAIFETQLPAWPAALILTCVMLVTLWRLHNGPRHGASTAELRTRYEEEIRRAAGREERNRLARDLHDSIKQQIFAIHTAAATAQAAMPSRPEAAAAAMARVRESARDAMTEMDTMLDQLRSEPMTVAGLVSALGKLCETTGLRTGAKSAFEGERVPEESAMPPGAAQAMLRVAQEAHSNAARHARPSNILTRLEASEGRAILTVTDDGSGFDADLPPSGMGLRNMRVRAEEFAGDLRIESGPGRGTLIRMTVPLRVATAAQPVRRGILATAALLAIIVVLWMSGAAGPNPLHPVLMLAVGAACAIFLALHLGGRRSVR